MNSAEKCNCMDTRFTRQPR